MEKGEGLGVQDAFLSLFDCLNNHEGNETFDMAYIKAVSKVFFVRSGWPFEEGECQILLLSSEI